MGEFSGGIESEKNRNESDMETREDDGKDIEVDANIKYDACSESRKHKGLDNDKLNLK